jgi:hypothetical protein
MNRATENSESTKEESKSRRVMSKKSNFKPGQPSPRSGLYQRIGPKGGKGAEVTSVKGKRLPPAPKGSSYKLVDPAKHKSGK